MHKNTSHYCCSIFQCWLDDPWPQFFYDPANRIYTVSAPKCLLKKNMTWPSYQIFFCPVCGKEFLTALTNKRKEIPLSEYGIQDPTDDLKKILIPEEFFTDEWWKKRGL